MTIPRRTAEMHIHEWRYEARTELFQPTGSEARGMTDVRGPSPLPELVRLARSQQALTEMHHYHGCALRECVRCDAYARDFR